MRPTSLTVVPDHMPGPHPTASDDLWWWWAPTLGPTSSLVAYLWAGAAAHADATITWDVDELANRVGLAQAVGRLWHAVDRLAKFHVVTFVSTDVVTLRVNLPLLPHRQRLRLPMAMQLAYEAVVAEKAMKV